jgi:glycosyltransferase involved in cell wall biosynthesis
LSDPTPELSIVIPVYRGAGLVGPLLDELGPVLASMDVSHEIVLVDDGCPHGSWEAIVREAGQRPNVRGLRLSRNFGQQIAVSAGIADSHGAYITIMDCDLQNPPTALPEILGLLKQGKDIVYTVSRQRNNTTDSATSRLFWFVLRTLLRVRIVPNQLMMRGMSRRFGDIFDRYPEVTRTVAGISNDIGLNTAVLEVENRARHSGKGSYNLLSRFNLMIHIVISLTAAPLNVIIYVSLTVLLATVVASIAYFIQALFSGVQTGFTTIILAIFFFGSLNTLILGIMGLYLANIYSEVRRRPLFLVQERTTHDK